MANRKSGPRHNKPNTTIDLKAVDPSKVNEAVTKKAADVADSAAKTSSSGYDILKPKEESTSVTGKPQASKNDEANKTEAKTGEASNDKSGAKTKEPVTSKDPIKTQSSVSPEKPAKSSGMGSLILSAVLGGGVALGGASLLSQNAAIQSMPVIGALFQGSADQSVESEIIADLSAKISVLSGEIETLKNESGADPIAQEALDLAKAADSASQAATAKIAELSQQVVADPSGVSIDVDGLKASIAGDQTKLNERISALESVKPVTIPPSLENDLTILKEQMTKLDGLSETASSMNDTLASLDERVKLVESSLNETVLPSMESVQAAAGAAIESQKVARSVSARALSAVLENGGSFAGELAAAEALIGQSESIAALRPLASKGILNESDLAADFKVTSDIILNAGDAVSEDAGFVNKLFSSAKTLVKVRPAGPVEGDTNSAIISRISAGLEAGNITEALAQWNSLSDEAKSVSASWEAKAKERLSAETHIKNIIGELGLSSPNQG